MKELYSHLESFNQILIKGFRKGSIIVDYIVLFNNSDEQLTIEDLNKISITQLKDLEELITLGPFILDSTFTKTNGIFLMM